LLLLARRRSARAALVGGARRSRGQAAAAPLRRRVATSEVALAKVEEPVDDDDDDDFGGACSIWTDERVEIDASLLKQPWSTLIDKVVAIDGKSVRACRKGAKQVATIGPASASAEMLERLFLCGVDVFRLNFSHGEHDEKLELIKRIRDLEAKYKHPICILADMQGPKQRCGKFADEKGVDLESGQTFRFDLDPALGDAQRAQLPHPEILTALTPGKSLLLDDGKIRMRVERKGFTYQGKDMFLEQGQDPPSSDVKECAPFIMCLVEVGGKLSARKGVNTPDVVLAISPITPKDREDIKFASRNDVDWIALSFVQRHEDMKELRALVASFCKGGHTPKLLAKIEKPSAVEDLPAILQESDGVMVARGDLGVEMNPEEVPFVQKDMILQALAASKPVIVATQMMESMIFSPSPTRAECSDIANAILDGCDAVMLSGESAVGKYPLECVEMQRRVIIAAERQEAGKRLQDEGRGLQRRIRFPPTLQPPDVAPGNAILASAVSLAEGLGAKAIVCFTATGRSVERLVQFRPSMPVLAVCPCLETARFLSLYRGVYATSDPPTQALASRVNTDGPGSVRSSEAIDVACKLARNNGLISKEDEWIVVICRLPLFTQGPLNVIRIANASGPGYSAASAL